MHILPDSCSEPTFETDQAGAVRFQPPPQGASCPLVSRKRLQAVRALSVWLAAHRYVNVCRARRDVQDDTAFIWSVWPESQPLDGKRVHFPLEKA